MGGGIKNKDRVSIRDNGSDRQSEPCNDRPLGRGRPSVDRCERGGERELVLNKATLLWIDLEMTGLDPIKDRILEVAAIATDMKLNPIAEFTAVVKVDEELIKERMVGEFWEKNKASHDALVAQNKEGKPIAEVERELIKFLDTYFNKEIYLAGNSIHQDRKFIEREMPKLNKRLHYRMLDVSAWKIYFENALHKKFTKPENHRALDDINGSIEELKWYLTFLK